MKVRGAVRRDGAAWLPEGQTAIEYKSLQPSTITSNAVQLKKRPVAACCKCQDCLADAVVQGAEYVCRFSTVSTHCLSSPWSHIHSLCSHNTRKSFVEGKKKIQRATEKNLTVKSFKRRTLHARVSKVCNY